MGLSLIKIQKVSNNTMSTWASTKRESQSKPPPRVSESRTLTCIVYLAATLVSVVLCTYLYLRNYPGQNVPVPGCKLEQRAVHNSTPISKPHTCKFDDLPASGDRNENLRKSAALNPSKWCQYEEIRRKCPEQCPAWMFDYIGESEL